MLNDVIDDGVTSIRITLTIAFGDRRTDLVDRHTFDAFPFLRHWSVLATSVSTFTFCTLTLDFRLCNSWYSGDLTFSQAAFLSAFSIVLQPGMWASQALITSAFRSLIRDCGS